MAKEECLPKEKTIDQIGILTSLEKIEVLNRHKDDKTFEIKLTFYVAKCPLAVSFRKRVSKSTNNQFDNKNQPKFN